MRRELAAAVIVVLAVTLASPVAAGPEETLKSMTRELERNFSKLEVKDYPKPYFISYLVRDSEAYDVSARFGAPIQRRSDRQRFVTCDVRVGSMELDNTQDQFPGLDMPYFFKPFASSAPLNEDDLALRKVLWSVTDTEYKQAVASYLKVKAQGIYTTQDPEFTGSFSPAPVVQKTEKPSEFIKTPEKLEKTVLAVSALLSAQPGIFDAFVSFDASRQDRYFVNSEGSRFYTSEAYFSYALQAFARAEDGSVIPHSAVFYARKLSELPDQKTLEKQALAMVDELTQLCKAEIMPPYSGPALLEGDTAGVFLHEALGHRLEGQRQTSGDEGGTFRGKLGSQILPETITVYDDPTLAAYKGRGLNGYYVLDDEGVVAQKVSLVEKGKLAGFLLTRRPVEQFKASNGHSRAGGMARPVARMGTLVLEASTVTAGKNLKAKLIALAKAQGKPFGILMRRAASGATNTSSWGFQAFKGVAHLVYKVDVETGAETLVRGVELLGTPLASLMKIEAVGDDPTVFDGICGAESGAVPVSTIVPSLLLSELEFQKAPPQREQKEILPPPEK
jgi:predicted Zn-dependent protease